MKTPVVRHAVEMRATPLLIGGFGVPSFVLAPLARDLAGIVVRTHLTVGCGEVEAGKVLDAVDRVDGPVVLVGHSRGGQLARVVAARRADRVERLVTVGTPRRLGPPNHRGVSLVASMLRRVPSRIALNCATAECCADFRVDLGRAVEVPWTAIWSRRDRIVRDGEARHEDATELVEVDATHLGLVTSARGRAAIKNAIKNAP